MKVLGHSLALLMWLSSAVAFAQGGDVVMLSNGGRLRGTIEVYEPGQDLVIVLSDGSRRTVPAAEVAQVIFGETPSAPGAPLELNPSTPTETPGFSTPTSPGPEPARPEPTPAPVPAEPPRPGPVGPPRGPDDPGGIPDVQHLGALAPIAGVPEGNPRTYSPGDDRDAWVEDPATRALPEGPLHVGIEVRVGARMLFGSSVAPFGLHLAADVSAVLDYRVAPRFHLRAAALFGVSSLYERTDRVPTSLYQQGTSAGSLGARFMLGFDIDRLFIVRLGGEVGGEYLPTFRRVEVYGGPEIDILGQLLDGGNLEIGLAFAFLRTRGCTLQASTLNPSGTFQCEDLGNLRLQVLAGWLF